MCCCTVYMYIHHFSHSTWLRAWLKKKVLCGCTIFCGCSRLLTSFYRLSAVLPSDRWFPLSHTFRSYLLVFAMSTPRALPAPGGNATASLALVNTTRPEEVVIHSGAATTEGDMSYQEEDFDPCRYDPRRDMPGVLDANIDISQLNTINFNNIDHRTAHVAVVQQGVDPTVASHLMAAQQHAFQSEANTLRL